MRSLLCISIVVFGTTPAAALELTEALSHTYNVEPALLAARSSTRSADESLAIAKSGFRPQISVTGSTQYVRRDNSFDTFQLNTTRSSITVDQNIYQGGATVAEAKRARHEIAASQQQLRAAEQNVFSQAIEAYLAVLRDQSVLAAAEANESRLERQLQAAEVRFEFGEVTRTDVAQAEARWAAATAERIDAESQLSVAQSRFVETIGLEPENLQYPALPEDLPVRLDDATAFVDNVPDVMLAEFNLFAAQSNIDVQYADILPRLDLQGSASHAEEPTNAIDRESELSATATLTIPIFQGGGEYARVRQAKQRAIENRYQVDDARRAARQQIQSQWLTLQSATARLTSITAQVRAAEIALDGVRQEALVGSRTVLDVLDQEQELFNAEVDEAQTRFDQLQAAFALKSAMGRLTARELNLDVNLYDPLSNLRYSEDRWIGVDVQAVD